MHRIPVRLPPPSSSGHRRAVAVAGGEVRGLPRQGLALLLALAAPVGVVGWAGQRSKTSIRSSGAGARNRSNKLGGGVVPAAGPARGTGGGGAGRATGQGQAARSTKEVDSEDLLGWDTRP
jgi:hypothetical protein